MNTLLKTRLINKNDLKIKNQTIESEYIPKDVLELFNQFLKSERASKQVSTNNGFIRRFFFHRVPKSRNDFSDETFRLDAEICKSNYKIYTSRSQMSSHEKALFKSFYSYLLENNIGTFKNLNLKLVNYNTVINLINNGYVFIKYEPMKVLPSADRWILYDDKNVKTFDFELLNAEYKKKMLKDFILTSLKPDLGLKYARFMYYVDFLNLLPIESNLPIKLNYGHVRQFKDLCKEKNNNNGTTFVKMSSIKALVLYFKNVRKTFEFSDIVLNSFRVDNMRSKGKTKYYTEEEMQTIISELKEMRDNTKDEDDKRYYALITIVVLYILNTAIRLESILRLKTDSLHEGMPGCYFYQVDAKRTFNEQYDIPKDLKLLHDEVITLTKDIRPEAPEGIKEDLFIYRKCRGKNIDILNRNYITSIINDICDKSNIAKLGVSGIRNRFMNNIITKLDAGSDLNLIAGLSKHSVGIHLNNYYDGEIEDMCSKLYNVNIGSTPFTALVTLNTSINSKTQNIVMNGCGVCSENSCQNNSEIDCILCKYFVTSPGNIPFIKQKISEIEEDILDCKSGHEKESLIVLKRIYVKLLSEIYIKINKEDGNGTIELH